MKKHSPIDVSRIFAEGSLIDDALKVAVRAARQRHKLAGHPVPEWRDGRVVWVPPEEIDVPTAPRRKPRG